MLWGTQYVLWKLLKFYSAADTICTYFYRWASAILAGTSSWAALAQCVLPSQRANQNGVTVHQHERDYFHFALFTAQQVTQLAGSEVSGRISFMFCGSWKYFLPGLSCLSYHSVFACRTATPPCFGCHSLFTSSLLQSIVVSKLAGGSVVVYGTFHQS